ncbi:MAG TPA: hypothetical protein VGS17_00290 [Candidatus Limnocylindria bacterium]|nr:hypothetical protein [Candidatus Limnocylindria bacterium]
MREITTEGFRVGIPLAACVVVLADVGLTPTFSWVPEVPLVLIALAVPIAAFSIAGMRAGTRSRTWVAGALAGAITGTIGGAAGGLAYVAFGKPLLNIAVGTVAGALGGAIVGAGSAWSTLRRT